MQNKNDLSLIIYLFRIMEIFFSYQIIIFAKKKKQTKNGKYTTRWNDSKYWDFGKLH